MMPTDEYDRWFDDTILPHLRNAVSPTIWPLYAERETMRRERTDLLDRIAMLERERTADQELIAALRARVKELERKLSEQEEPEPPSLPEPSDYDGGRIHVVWATGTAPSVVQSSLRYGDHTYAIVVTADVKNMPKEGMAEIRDQLADARSKGVKVYAYVRAPVHMRINEQWTLNNVSPAVPFEHAVGDLVRQKNAYAFDAAGKPILHSGGYDVYIDPTEIAEEHAALVMKHVWDPEFFDGVLADGLVTNQPYAWAANFTVTEQREALLYWADQVNAPIVGNGSWEPKRGDFNPWIVTVHGAFDEDVSHPRYDPDNPNIQTPPLSERWAMHMKAAQAWASTGREYFIGDNFRIFNLPEDQRRKFIISSALMVNARVVMIDHPWLRLSLGKPLGEPVIIDETWRRSFKGGIVSLDSDRLIGSIEY